MWQNEYINKGKVISTKRTKSADVKHLKKG